MSEFAWVVIITLIAGVGGTGIGGAIGALFGRNNSRIVSLLLSFAAGIMLAISCFDLIPEAIRANGSTAEPYNILLVIGGITLGFGLVYLLNHFIDKKTNHEIKHIDESHPKTADELDELIHSNHLFKHEQEQKTTRNNSELIVAGIVMACAISLHNIPEGMVIGASIANSGIVASGTGITLAVVIGLHNIPEGMGISVPLIAGGKKRLTAILITALCGLPTVIGAMLGYWLGTLGAVWLCLALSFASGAMLYVVFGELLPESILLYRSKAPAIAVMIGIFVGLIVIYF